MRLEDQVHQSVLIFKTVHLLEIWVLITRIETIQRINISWNDLSYTVDALASFEFFMVFTLELTVRAEIERILIYGFVERTGFPKKI